MKLGGVKVTLISMLSARRKDKGAKKDIPEWKRLLLEQDEPAAAASSSTAQKRPREEEAPAPAAPSRQNRAPDEEEDPLPVVDDDDDDEDVDLTAYDLGGGDDDDDDEVSAAPAYQPTREELLLMREARDTSGKSRKTYFADESARSLEKSAGSERKLDALKLKKLIATGKLGVPAATTMGGGGF